MNYQLEVFAEANGRTVHATGAPDTHFVSWTVRRGAIERQRILRGWTRNQLAAAAQIDPKTLRDLLGGRRRPNLSTMDTLARALDLRLAEAIVISERVSSRRREATAPSTVHVSQELLPLQ